MMLLAPRVLHGSGFNLGIVRTGEPLALGRAYSEDPLRLTELTEKTSCAWQS
ncbi:MAG: hypothetical protein J6Q85_03415 [Clostridia bacterium]|nr:hypothetical protein [Clostridia bacterium]